MRRSVTGILILLAALGAAAPGACESPRPSPPPPPAPPVPPERIELRFSDDPESLVEADAAAADTIAIPVRWRHDGSTGDLVRFGEDIVVAAGQQVRGDVVAVGGSIDVRGTVDGDAVSLGGRVRIRPGGEVRGEAISIGGRVVQEGSGGLRGSSVSMPAIPAWLFDVNVVNLVGQGVKVLQLLLFLGLTLLLAWIATHVAPDRTERAAAYLRSRPGPAFLWGVVAMVGIVPSVVAVALVGALLCVTIIGIPVAVLLFVGYAVGIALVLFWGYLVGALIVGAWAAQRLRPQQGAPGLWRSLLCGIVVLFAPAVLAAAFKSLGFLAPVSTGLGVVLGTFNVLLFSCATLFGIGAVLGSRAGTSARGAGGAGGADGFRAVPPGAPPASPAPFASDPPPPPLAPAPLGSSGP